MNRWTSRWICGVLAAWLALTMLGPAWAAGEAGWQAADTIQKALQQAQLALSNGDVAATSKLVEQAGRTAKVDLTPLLSSDASAAIPALTAALARQRSSTSRSFSGSFPAA